MSSVANTRHRPTTCASWQLGDYSGMATDAPLHESEGDEDDEEGEEAASCAGSLPSASPTPPSSRQPASPPSSATSRPTTRSNATTSIRTTPMAALTHAHLEKSDPRGPVGASGAPGVDGDHEGCVHLHIRKVGSTSSR